MTGLLYPKPEPHALRKIAQRQADKRAEAAAYRHVTKRDGGRCRACGAKGTNHHHFPYRSQGGGSDVRHLVLLCLPCHQLAHAHWIEFSGNADIPGQLVIDRRDARQVPA